MAEKESGVQVLLSSEAEAYVEALTAFDISNIGSSRWYQQHEYLEKLNMQAVVSASKEEDEFVKEQFISYEKIPLLIQDLITTEVWKEKIFPEIILWEHENDVIFPLYTVLYHEAVVCNLLETLLFHQESCDSLGETSVDLIDYCYNKLTHLVSTWASRRDEDDDEFDVCVAKGSALTSTVEELKRQDEKLSFDVAMKTISILSYIITNLSVLPVSCTERILNTTDTPLLLVQLLQTAPWTREKSGKLMKYDNAKWRKVEAEEHCMLTKTEGQVWISILQLLINPEYQQKYELSSYRKNTLLRLRPYLTEVLLDQIPSLIELQRYLDQLMILDAPPTKKDFILEQVPEIRERILKAYEGQWTSIAKKQSHSYFNPSNSNFKSWAMKLAETYSTDAFETLITDPPKCAFCSSLATKRCSRCANEWYCSRECQVSHWPKHKQPCNLMFQALDAAKSSGV